MSAPADLRRLYPAAILDHGHYPRNRRPTSGCSRRGRAANPLCGDEVVVGLGVDEEGVVREAAFQGQSCVIATASASIMTELLVGRARDEARMLFDRLEAIATGALLPQDPPQLALLSCISTHPERTTCATLAWRAALQALDERRQP